MVPLTLFPPLATFGHGGSYSLELFKEGSINVDDEDQNELRRRLLLYLAIVHVDHHKANDENKLKKYFDKVAQMVPVQAIALHSVDDTVKYQTRYDSALIKKAKEWLGDERNKDQIQVAASWLINHCVSPSAQRGAWTLQSFLATHIMESARTGTPLDKYNAKLKL